MQLKIGTVYHGGVYWGWDANVSVFSQGEKIWEKYDSYKSPSPIYNFSAAEAKLYEFIKQFATEAK
jgi:hypothetical protein